LIWIKGSRLLPDKAATMTRVPSLPNKWLPVSIAPSDADLEVCILNEQGLHALVFPVRKRGADWVDASTKKRIDIQPTHWRTWTDRAAN
jgi:hypothetical protein